MQRNFETFIKKNNYNLNENLLQATQQANNNFELLNFILQSNQEKKIEIVKGYFERDELYDMFKNINYPYDSGMNPREKISTLNDLFEVDLFEYFTKQGFSVKEQFEKLKQIFDAKNLCEILENASINEDEKTKIKAFFPDIYPSKAPEISIIRAVQTPEQKAQKKVGVIKNQCENNLFKIRKKLLYAEIYTHVLISNQKDPVQLNYGIEMYEAQNDWLTLDLANHEISSQMINLLHTFSDLMMRMIYNEGVFFKEHVALFASLKESGKLTNLVGIEAAVQVYFSYEKDTPEYKKSFLSILLPPLLKGYESDIILKFNQFGVFNDFCGLLRENKELYKPLGEADEISAVSNKIRDLIIMFLNKVISYKNKDGSPLKSLDFTASLSFKAIKAIIDLIISRAKIIEAAEIKAREDAEKAEIAKENAALKKKFGK